MLHFANSAEGVDTLFLNRHLGLSQGASFHLAKRIRLHLASLEFDRRIGAAGKAVQVNLIQLPKVHRPGTRSISAKLLLASDRDTVVAIVIKDARRYIMRRVLKIWCNPGIAFFTTCFEPLRVSSEFGTRRPILQYSTEKADPHNGWTDIVKGFMNYVQRPLRDHHRRIDHSNLWRYIVKANFRYNRRLESARVFSDMVAQFRTLRPPDITKIQRAFSHVSDPMMDEWE